MVWQIYLAVCYCPASFVLSTTSLELLPIIGTSGQDTTRALACLRRAAQPPPPIVARSTALTWQTNRIMDNSSRSQSRGAAQRKSRNLYRIRWCRRWRRRHFSRYAELSSDEIDGRSRRVSPWNYLPAWCMQQPVNDSERCQSINHADAGFRCHIVHDCRCFPCDSRSTTGR
jgi:hypothetical protein